MINCKRGVTLRSTAEWEKKTHPHTHIPTHPHAHAHTHTDIQRIQQTLPKKRAKGTKEE